MGRVIVGRMIVGRVNGNPLIQLSAVSGDWILMSHGRKKCCDWLTSYSHRGTRQLIGMWGLSQMVL